jgi:hypothetical protein
MALARFLQRERERERDAQAYTLIYNAHARNKNPEKLYIVGTLVLQCADFFQPFRSSGNFQKQLFLKSQRWDFSKNDFFSFPTIGKSPKTVFSLFPTLGNLQKRFFVKSQRWEISKNSFSSNPNVGTSSKTFFRHFPTLGLIYNSHCHVKNQEYDKDSINHLKSVAPEKIKKQYTRVKQNPSDVHSPDKSIAFKNNIFKNLIVYI